MTVQKFYRPSGASTQKRGVKADVVMPSFSSVLEGIGEEDLDYCIEWDQVPRSRYVSYRMVSPDLIAQLQTTASQRINQSEKFAEVKKVMERYKRQKAEQSVSVNEAEYFAREAELDAAAEEAKLLDEPEGEEETIKRDYYLEEVFAIGADYIKALRRARVESNLNARK